MQATAALATSSGVVTWASGNFSAIFCSASRVRPATKSVSTPAGETEDDEDVLAGPEREEAEEEEEEEDY